MGILDQFSLKTKVALVTAGAGPLFGRSLSAGLAEAGATVITASRSLEANLKYADELRSHGYEAHGMELDVTDVASIERLHQAIIKKCRPPRCSGEQRSRSRGRQL